MNILGISGLERAMAFKRMHWPGLDEREYRISQGHDAAAALVVDGVPVAAAAEERFNRRKHSPRFPSNAIAWCLKHTGMALDEIDLIAHSFDYVPYRGAFLTDQTSASLYRQVLSRDALLELVDRELPGFPPERVRHVNHHLAHAASAYYTSGWDSCLVVVIDAMGEAHSASIYRAQRGDLTKLAEIPALDSIGILYSLVTHHLGFEFNCDEYKIMGLAPYGDPARFRAFFDEIVELRPNGSIRIPILKRNRTLAERENFTVTRRFLAEHLIPPRPPDQEITQDHKDVAAALQECLNEVMLHICGHFGSVTGMRRLALAGGVALNCTANGRLFYSGLFDDIYVQPAAGDDGSALGAALLRAAQAGEISNARFPAPFLGPACSTREIESALRDFGDSLEIHRAPDLTRLCENAAQKIAEGCVVAWYRGRMEFGPRALGNRSILADPSRPEMRDRINATVKMREAFRPFAPAVTLERVHRCFDVEPGTELPYMVTAVDVREQFRSLLPAITHENGSARVQTVSAFDNPAFHALLQAVGRITGREILLNTSFNVQGQPIVNTPREAIETFLATSIDCLFLENVMIARSARARVPRSEQVAVASS